MAGRLPSEAAIGNILANDAATNITTKLTPYAPARSLT